MGVQRIGLADNAVGAGVHPRGLDNLVPDVRDGAGQATARPIPAEVTRSCSAAITSHRLRRHAAGARSAAAASVGFRCQQRFRP